MVTDAGLVHYRTDAHGLRAGGGLPIGVDLAVRTDYASKHHEYIIRETVYMDIGLSRYSQWLGRH